MVPERNATNANYTRRNNTYAIISDVIQTMDFLIALILDGKKSHELCKKQSVWKLLLMMDVHDTR